MPCLFAAMLAALLLASGCSSTPKKNRNSGRMASITATNRSTEDIDTALRTVFTRHEYQEAKAEGEEDLIFEKKASFMSGAVYSDWYSGGVWERIKVYERDIPGGQTVVECDGYMVKERDDPLFAEEVPEHSTKRSHCQKLMDEVELELKAIPLTNAPPAAKIPAGTNAPPAAR